MRHLCCSRCSRRLIDNFWLMVEAETEPTFRTISLVCDCGAETRISPRRRPRWVKFPEALAVIERYA